MFKLLAAFVAYLLLTNRFDAYAALLRDGRSTSLTAGRAGGGLAVSGVERGEVSIVITGK